VTDPEPMPRKVWLILLAALALIVLWTWSVWGEGSDWTPPNAGWDEPAP
jgi:hypothetical protein